MIHSIEFYAVDRVDVGIGASKDVEVAHQADFVEHASNEAFFRGHPNPGAVTFELLNRHTLRVTNNSGNVVSLWPGEIFLTVVPGHPVHDALSEVAEAKLEKPVKETTFTGVITQVGTDITALHLAATLNEKLRRADYNTVEELEDATDSELLAVPGLGKAAVTKVRKALAEYLSEQELQDWMSEWANDQRI